MRLCLFAFALLLTPTLYAQQPFPLAPPPGPQVYPQPLLATPDETGFTPIFDGKTLNGWEGDPTYWSVRDGLLTGEVTPQTLLKQNSFLIWRGGHPADFEMLIEFRITPQGNSGINYRSVEIPGTRYLLRGYQADIDGPAKYTGQNYEERGRTFLAQRGQFTRATPDGVRVLAMLGSPDELRAAIHTGLGDDGWNTYHLILRGNVLIHILNGQLTSEVLDDDPAHRRADGLIGVQVHVGPPMTVQYRRILLKPLP